MCIRQAGSLATGDTLLEPTLFDDVGELLDHRASVLIDSSGAVYLHVLTPLVMRHSEEESVPVPTGLYKMKGDKNWGGAPLVGLRVE